MILIEDLTPDSADAGVAAHYGDPMREQRTLATAVGLVDRSNRDVIAVPGEERASWLHTLTTQHLSDLKAGQGSELLVLSPHGHLEHRHVTGVVPAARPDADHADRQARAHAGTPRSEDSTNARNRSTSGEAGRSLRARSSAWERLSSELKNSR